MPETKYGKYLTKDCLSPSKEKGHLMISNRHIDSYIGGDFSIVCVFKTRPQLVIPEPHKHEFDQYLCFSGINPYDIRDFDGEIEFSLGEEQEKHIIDSPTIVYIPAGLTHGPLNYAKVNKPFLTVDVAITNKYKRI